MPFDEVYLHELAEQLRGKGVQLEDGLSDDEINRTEKEYAINFPPDLRMLLKFVLPISEGFPNWRTGLATRPITEWEDGTLVVRGHKLIPISDRFAWPSEGICFDVEKSDFWVDAWGPRPSSLSAALETAKKQIAATPRLIPIYEHRYIPSEPLTSGNPVFSVYQTDVIYYGNDLADYFAREFGVSRPEWAAKQPREIRFWSRLSAPTISRRSR